MAETLLDWLERAAAVPERGIRLLDRREEERWLSWDRLREEALGLAGSLAEVGVSPGDRVALVFPTGEGFLVSFFGSLAAGAVPVPLYPPVRLGRLEEYRDRTVAMLRSVGARLVLAEPRIHRILGEVAEAARPELGCRTLASLPRAGTRSPAAVRSDDLALIQFSSGTTRDPHPVALSHRAVEAQVRGLNRFWPDGGTLVHSGVSWLPLYHDMGLIGCVFAALERPADLTLIPPEAFLARPALWIRAISRYGATVSPAPDFAYAMAAERIRDEELAGVDLSTWHVALNGAEAVGAGTLRAFARRFAKYGFRPEALTPVYGLSEASLAVTFSPPRQPFRVESVDRDELGDRGVARSAAGGRELVSVGFPLPGVSVEVRDEGRRPLPERREGRIWTRGPALMDGYFGLPELTADVLVDGWLDTGDLGFLLDGELFVTGRAKDVVVVRGQNFSPEEIERTVWAVAGARRGCAVAVSRGSEGGGGEELLLFLERARDATETEIAALPEAAAAAVRAGIGLQPARVEILAPGTLPRTSSGKLRRGETLRRWEAGRLAPPAGVGPLRLAGALARSGLAHWRARRNRGG